MEKRVTNLGGLYSEELIHGGGLFTEFYGIWKETARKPSKVAASKNFFSSVYVADTTCFDECFLFDVITERYDILYKFIITQRFFPTVMLLSIFLKKWFERRLYYFKSFVNKYIILLMPKKGVLYCECTTILKTSLEAGFLLSAITKKNELRKNR